MLKTLHFEKSKEEFLNQLAHDTHLICRVQAVQGLANWAQDDDVVAALIRAAKSDVFWGVRQEAVQVLGKKSSDAVRTALLEIAARDAKSHVRREAISALGNFAHDDVRSFLRTAVKQDRSYQAAAEALRALRRVDGEKCEPDLLEALTVPSQRDVIAKAAVDGLVERRSIQGADRIAELLRQPQVPERRTTYIAALARLKPDDTSYLDLLHKQLHNERRNVRRAAADALVELGNPSALEWLQERRAKEITPAAILAIDQSIDRLRAKQQDAATLRKELDELRRQNKSLEERLKKLEQK